VQQNKQQRMTHQKSSTISRPPSTCQDIQQDVILSNITQAEITEFDNVLNNITFRPNLVIYYHTYISL
jgi:hypothetical protein